MSMWERSHVAARIHVNVNINVNNVLAINTIHTNMYIPCFPRLLQRSPTGLNLPGRMSHCGVEAADSSLNALLRVQSTSPLCRDVPQALICR